MYNAHVKFYFETSSCQVNKKTFSNQKCFNNFIENYYFYSCNRITSL